MRMQRVFAALVSLLLSWSWAGGVFGRSAPATDLQAVPRESVASQANRSKPVLEAQQEAQLFAYVGQVPISDLHKLDGEQVLGYVLGMPQRVRVAVMEAWCAAPVCR